MWFDQKDDNDFVMVNLKMAKRLALRKGGMINLTSEGGSVSVRYKVEDMPDGLILTAKKIPAVTEWVATVSTEVV